MIPEDVLSRFLEEPGGHVIFDTDLRVCGAGPEFIRITRQERESVMGRYFANILTEPNPQRHQEFVGEMRAAVAIAIKTGDTVKLPIRRCDVTPVDGSRPVEKWWRVALIPVREEGTVKWIVGRFEDLSVEMIAARKIDTLRKSNYSLYFLTLVVMALIAWGINSSNGKVNNVSKKTCQVQSDYLGSTRPLSRVMTDISDLLIAPQPKGAPRESTKVRKIVTNMQADLSSYLRITGGLPENRKCQ